jgi:hypothetical protein
MKRIKLPHSVIVKAPGLLPMLYMVRELVDKFAIPERTFRDWLEMGAPHSRDKQSHIWIEGREFAAWVASQRKPVKAKSLTDNQAYCMRCNEVVEMLMPEIIHIKGKLVNIRGQCPQCGCTINRGGRLPANPTVTQLSSEETL